MSDVFLLYIDPGSGSYLIQVIIAAALGVVFFFKNIWLFIKSFFTRSPKKTNPPDTSSDAKT
jgi:hypothetical protein